MKKKRSKRAVHPPSHNSSNNVAVARVQPNIPPLNYIHPAPTNAMPPPIQGIPLQQGLQPYQPDGIPMQEMYVPPNTHHDYTKTQDYNDNMQPLPQE